MTSPISVNTAKVLDTMIALAPIHGSYYAIMDLKNAFSGHAVSHVSEATIEQLKKEGVTLADVMDAMKVHSEHNKFLQQYIADEMTNNPELSAVKVADAVRLLLRKDAQPAAAGTPQAELQNAGINDLDTSFVFTSNRLVAVDALVANHVNPASAFSAIDQMRGEFVNALPDNIKVAANKVSTLVMILVSEQMLSLEDMKGDLRRVMHGDQTSYAFKVDYVFAYNNLKEFMELNLRGLNLEEFVMAFFTPEYIRDIELSVIVRREAEATDMVYRTLNNHVRLPAAYLPTTLNTTHVGDLYNRKMYLINEGIFRPWAQNHSGYDFPKPVCPPVIFPAVADSNAANHEGMVIGAVAVSALWVASYLAYPAYKTIIKPVATKTMQACHSLGLLLFSCKENFKLKVSKLRDERDHLHKGYIP
jgi:hypothetical protein